MKTQQLTRSSPKRQLVPDIIATACKVPQHSLASSNWVVTTCIKMYLENSLVTVQVNCAISTAQC